MNNRYDLVSLLICWFIALFILGITTGIVKLLIEEMYIQATVVMLLIGIGIGLLAWGQNK